MRVGSAFGVSAMVDPGGQDPAITPGDVKQRLGVCPSIAADPQNSLVTYVAVRPTDSNSPDGPGVGLYKVNWSADGYSSATSQQIKNTSNPSNKQPGRTDRIIAVIEDGETVIYAGTVDGIMRYPTSRPVTEGCDDWNGDNFPHPYTVGGICAKAMPSGHAIVYAGISPLYSEVDNLTSHLYRTVDGGKSWQPVDKDFQPYVYGDRSHTKLYCFDNNPQFLPSGSQFDVGTLAYIADVNGTGNDRFLCFGRTCVWGCDVDCHQSPAGTLGRLQVFGHGMNGSEAHAVGKDPTRNVLYGGDVDWDVLWWPRLARYPDYAYDHMPQPLPLDAVHGGLRAIR